MAKAWWCGAEVHAAARTFAASCLRDDGSLFTPGATVWTAAGARTVEARIGSGPRGDSFIERLERQLQPLAAAEIQLGAEALFVALLAEHDTGAATKREHLRSILALISDPVTIPPELDAAFDAGATAGFGAAKAHRDAYLRFLLRLAQRVKQVPPAGRATLIDEPWQLRDAVQETRTSTDAMMANAILHLLFPDTFEYMISEAHRRQLIGRFAAAPGVAEAENADRKLAVIRALTTQGAAGELNLYGDPLQRIWKDGPAPRWDIAVRFARKLFARKGFDAEERAYKLEVARLLSRARDALLLAEDGWGDALRAGIAHRRNNLTSWQANDRFLRWCAAEPDAAAAALRTLWADPLDESALPAFLDLLPPEAVAGPGTRLSLASLLLMGVDPGRFPFYKPTPHDALRAALGLPATTSLELDANAVYRPSELATRLGVDARRVRELLRGRHPREEEDSGTDWELTAEQAHEVVMAFSGHDDHPAPSAIYASWVELLEELRLRMLGAGTQLRDLLDAQSVAWWLVCGPIPDDWDTEERAALEAFRAGDVAVGTTAGDARPAPAAALPPASAELSATLHLPQAWLQDLLTLLERKRQLILYGPPGTGKTFIARELGRHVAEHGGASRLVQFHPSYTYEDFFEGYRPLRDESGGLHFELRPGVLRQLAGDAEAHPDRPHVLVVDEINRGNIAKIFGELYFLLEYRDEEIQLQYSREPFRLPPNLYVVGTMNTVDRSIALVDAALRRRFAFVALRPTEAPVSEVLARWIARHQLDPEPVAVLEALNRTINDQEMAIGHSYFITRDDSQPVLEQIWRHDIVPLLEDRFHGSQRDLEADFGLARMRALVAEAADVRGVDAADGA